jgi:hypothetical protein
MLPFISQYWAAFVELVVTPFEHVELVWGIVPLYFALLLGEMTSTRANYRTAIQTGFSFLWAGVQWLFPYFRAHGPNGPHLELYSMIPIKMFFTFLVLVLGAIALVSGIREKFPRYCQFLGYTRFANYFMIAIFALQVGSLRWTWDYLIAIFLFAPPVWLILHFGLMPVRK